MKKALAVLLIIAVISGGAFFYFFRGKADADKSTSAVSVSAAQTDLCVILGTHHNHPLMSKCCANLKEVLNTVCEYGGNITLIVNDGSPYVLDSLSIDPVASNLSKNQTKRMVTSRVAQILSIINNAKPACAETDLLSAIHSASNALATASNQKLLFILDNCVASTTGILDLTEKGAALMANPNTVLDHLDRNDVFDPGYIHLADVQVIWDTFTSVGGSQPTLTPTAAKQYTAFWKQFLKLCGSESSVTILGGDNADCYEGLFNVSPVPIPAIDNDLGQVAENGVTFSEKTLGFRPNSTDFSDPQAAAALLKQVADVLCQSKKSIVVAGQIATVTSSPDAGKAFSASRAMTVKDSLVKYGVPESHITCIGLGYTSPFQVPDTSPNGALIEEKAVQNRVTIIAPVNSALGIQLLAEAE